MDEKVLRFIKRLKKEGITGVHKEIMIRQYIQMMSE